MKLQYQNPMVSFHFLSTEDILTLSVDASPSVIVGESWDDYVHS